MPAAVATAKVRNAVFIGFLYLTLVSMRIWSLEIAGRAGKQM
jgi:hypothetical protein